MSVVRLGPIKRLVRFLTAWAWKWEIFGYKEFDRIVDDKWRYRKALEGMLKSAVPHPRMNPTMFVAWEKAKIALQDPKSKEDPSSKSDRSTCKICGREMNSSEDCGGDCVYCMAEAGDPECIQSCIDRAKDVPHQK